MMHDPETLASAYLDGELTDEERLVAEADPAVMAEVEQLRALRAGLTDVEPPSDHAREAAIGAAMAAFHEQIVPAATPEPVVDRDTETTVVPMWRRFANPQWLGTAAAALVLVVGVGVIATRTGGDDDDSFDSATDAVADEPADDGGDLPDADAGRIAESELADETFAAESGDDAEMEMADEPASAMVAEEPADDMAGDEMSDADAAEEPAEEPADEAADDGGLDMFPPALDDPSLHFEFDAPIVGPVQLRAAAWYLLEQRDEGVLGPTPEYRCEFYNVLSEALFDVDGEIRAVLLEIDETQRTVYVVERDGCVVLASVELDEP